MTANVYFGKYLSQFFLQWETFQTNLFNDFFFFRKSSLFEVI